MTKLNASAILQNQNSQYADKIILSDTVPANTQKQGAASVSNLGHFLCQFITGRFQTASLVSSTHYIDDAISHLRGQLIDGAGQRKLFDDFIPFDLFLSPGRVKFANTSLSGVSHAISNNIIADAGVADTAPDSNNLFYPLELDYIFSANSNIILDVKNDSNVDLSYDIVFHGIRILHQAA